MIIADLVALATAGVTFGYLYFSRGERHLGLWALGFLALIPLDLGVLVLPPGWPPGLAAQSAFVLTAAAFFYSAGGMLSGVRWNRVWLMLIGIGISWSIAFAFLTLPEIALMPVLVLLGAIMIATGVNLIRHGGTTRLERYLAGGAFILWGVHTLDYPLVADIEWFKPIGWLISFCITLTTTITVLLLYLRRSQEELIKREARLAHAEKLETVGRFAGRVAHDFNNMLTVIRAGVDLLKRRSEEQDRLAHIGDAVDRAVALTAQLLSVSGRQVSQPRRVDLAASVRGLNDLLGSLVGPEANVSIDCPDPAWVSIDPAQLEQVILNLVANAKHATATGGEVRLIVRTIEAHEHWPCHADRLPPGSYVEFKVSDTGQGIGPEALPHVFDPFFTTKTVGEGTGLGLWSALSVARNAGGGILADSELGRGTTLTLRFPQASPGERATAVQQEHEATAPGGTERVLAVDDDPDVRQVLVQTLKAHGYRTLEADSGEAALRMIQSHEVDLVLTDIVMPRISGLELADRIKQDHPEIAVLLTSGYVGEEERRVPEGANFLPKPFSAAELANAVRQALDG